MAVVPTEAKNIADVAARVREVLLLGSAALEETTAFATAAQGLLADSALQPAAIGVTVQAYNADLAAIAALTSAADKAPYATGAGAWAMMDVTAAGRALLDDADAAAQRTTLELGTAAILNTGRAIGNIVKYEDDGGFPALYVEPRLILRKENPTNADVYNVGILRSAAAGGTSGFVNSALRVETLVNSVTTAYEWAGLFKIDVNAAGGGEHVALYAQGNKNADNTLWSACTELRDWIANPTTGSVGIEIGMFVTGTDTNKSRYGIDVSLGAANGVAGTNVITGGIRIGPTNGDTTLAQFTNGIQISGKGICGLNIVNMDITYGDRLVRLPENAIISWRNQSTDVESALLAWNSTIVTWQRTGMLITTAAPTGGTAGALPAQPVGYINEQINGTMVKIPYYS